MLLLRTWCAAKHMAGRFLHDSLGGQDMVVVLHAAGAVAPQQIPASVWLDRHKLSGLLQPFPGGWRVQ